MSLDLHREAERHMGEADAALSRGDFEDAMISCSNVAAYESMAFEQIPADRPKTRGVIAISACSSYLQAAHWAEVANKDQVMVGEYRRFARVHIDKYLALTDPPLPDWARAQLETLAEDMDAEYARRATRA